MRPYVSTLGMATAIDNLNPCRPGENCRAWTLANRQIADGMFLAENTQPILLDNY